MNLPGATDGHVFKAVAPMGLWPLGAMALLVAAALLIARSKRPGKVTAARFASRGELKELHSPGRRWAG